MNTQHQIKLLINYINEEGASISMQVTAKFNGEDCRLEHILPSLVRKDGYKLSSFDIETDEITKWRDFIISVYYTGSYTTCLEKRFNNTDDFCNWCNDIVYDSNDAITTKINSIWISFN